MVDRIDLLTSIVEFSIGLGGFSGVVAVFVQRTGQFAAVDRYRISNLLVMGLAPAFLAFLSLGFLELMSDRPEVWRLSSLVLGLFVAVLFYFIPRGRSNVPDAHRHVVGPAVFIFFSVTFVVMLILQSLNALNMFGSYAFTIYYFGLVVMLLLGVAQFVRIIMVRPQEV